MTARALRPLLHLAATLVAVLALLGAGEGAARAQVAGTPPELAHVGVDEHLDGPLPLDAQFRDHTGKPVRLGDYFDGKRPVVLTFAYHSCPVLCSMVLNAAANSLSNVPWTVGKEVDVVTISIDPNESLEKTAAKRASILAQYGRAQEGWHFLVGDAANIARVAQAAGFQYQYDADQQNWGHPSVMMLVKPNGHMARYLYGLEFSPSDVRIGLLEASEGRHISTVEQIILYCYHYDPKGGRYVLVATRVMQVGGGATAIALVSTLLALWLKERRKGGLLARLEPGASHPQVTTLAPHGEPLPEKA